MDAKPEVSQGDAAACVRGGTRAIEKGVPTGRVAKDRLAHLAPCLREPPGNALVTLEEGALRVAQRTFDG